MDDPKVVLAQLPPCVVKHPAKLKELRTQWDHGCSKILADAKLPPEMQIQVVLGWLTKAGINHFVLGKLVLSFARPLPAPPTEDQRKERRQKSFIRLAYQDDIPHLRAVNKVVTQRLETVPTGTLQGSLKIIDSRDDREKESPGTLFAEFEESINQQVALQYKPQTSDNMFDAAE